jgi:diguanylate cyclase (GGDEF)-like protein
MVNQSIICRPTHEVFHRGGRRHPVATVHPMKTQHRRPEPDFQQRYDVLLDIGRTLTGTLEPDELYRTIYEQASRVLETTGFYISLYDAEQDQGTIVFYADRGEIDRPEITYRGSESRAIREGKPILEELRDPARAILLLGSESDDEVTRSVIAAPMLREGRVVGVISAQSYRVDAYSAADLELLMAIAGLAAVAVSNARSMAELEHQRRESQQLEQIGRALSASLELDQVLQRIVAATQELVQADGVAVWLLRPEGDAEVAMTAGDSALPRGTTTPVPPALHRHFTESQGPLRLERSGTTAFLPTELGAGFDAESAIAVPLIAEGELIGALSVSQVNSRSYRPGDVRLLERLAFHAAIAVANARLHEQVRLLSLTDPLTGLPNRRHMDILLDKEFAAAERGRALTVVLLDLDGFKIFNDTEGHQAGDEALRRFAEILSSETRAMNLAARYGGDEFIAILSDTDQEGGRSLYQRVLTGMRDDLFMRQMTASAGIASYQPGMLNPADLIRAADEALYLSKAEQAHRLPTN